MLRIFNWLRIEVATMKCYKHELLASDSKLLGLNVNAAIRTHTLSSLDAIWQSLTTNARKVLQKLAECSMEVDVPIDFFSFYQIAR